MNLEETLRRIDSLRADLSADIIIQEEIYEDIPIEEYQAMGIWSQQSSGSRCVQEEIREPNNKVRDAAKKELKAIFENSPYQIVKEKTAKLLGIEFTKEKPCPDYEKYNNLHQDLKNYESKFKDDLASKISSAMKFTLFFCIVVFGCILYGIYPNLNIFLNFGFIFVFFIATGYIMGFVANKTGLILREKHLFPYREKILSQIKEI